MAKSKEITCRCFISIDGADPVPMETLTDAQRDDVSKKMSERLSKSMSDYYTQHPDKYLKLIKSGVATYKPI